jgi:hypothetical protein
MSEVCSLQGAWLSDLVPENEAKSNGLAKASFGTESRELAHSVSAKLTNPSVPLEKHYSTDWAKAKARDILCTSIESGLLGSKKPQDLKVLCLPGIDATEIVQVYDRLGIPRKNIIGLEREPRLAAQITKLDLGIELHQTSVIDYAKTRDRPNFDVISLDYTGALLDEQIGAIRALTSRSDRNRFVLHQANLARRDGDSAMLYPILNRPVELILPHEGDVTDPIAKVLERQYEMMQKRGSDSSLNGERTSALTMGLLLACQGPIDYGSLLEFLWTDQTEEILDGLEKRISEVRGIPYRLTIRDNPYVPSAFEGMALDEIIHRTVAFRLSPLGIDAPVHHALITEAIHDTFRHGRTYYPTELKEYSYISESGSPMIGNVMTCHWPYKRKGLAEPLARPLGHRNKLEFEGLPYVKAIIAFFDDISKQPYVRGDREFLGNAAKPMITKARAIEEFTNGASVNEVKEKYRGWSRRPLAQWKAHVTMGTYDETQAEQDDVDDIGDSGLTLPKEDAIDLIGAGIPIEEIHSAFPEAYSLAQLRAFKAHVTMGTYKL